MKVRAAVAVGAGKPLEMRDLDLDDPRDDEVLVRIVGVGVCHTDIVFKDTEMVAPPAVLGHEGAGVVEKVGAGVRKVAPGDRVAITFRSCGACPRCGSGDPAYCLSMPALNYAGMRTDGSRSFRADETPVASNFFGQSSFATHTLAYERNLVKIADDLPLELMGPLGCGVQTGAGAILRSLDCEPGSSVAIAGGGPVGLSAVMGARIRGCNPIILIEPYASRRALALEFGATHVIDPAAVADVSGAVREIAPDGVAYAIDATGSPSAHGALLGALGPKGVLGLVGVAPPETPLPGEVNGIITFGHMIKGIIEGDSDPDVFLPELIDHYRAGALPFDRMITTFPLDEINEAIAAQHRGECVKAVLLPGA